MSLYRGCKGVHFHSYRVIVSILRRRFHDYGYHVKASCVGMLIGLPVCLLIGLVVQVISWAAA